MAWLLNYTLVVSPFVILLLNCATTYLHITIDICDIIIYDVTRNFVWLKHL